MAAKLLRLIGLAAFTLMASSNATLPQILNPSAPFTLPQEGEIAVSPALPGTAPGMLFNQTTTGTNPLTGLPCSGEGSLAVSGAGVLADTVTPPPDATSSPAIQLPSITSVFGSASSLGSC